MDMLTTPTLHITPEMLRLIAEIDEFKGAWKALGALPQERLAALRRVAAIESIGSSIRMESCMEGSAAGGMLLDGAVERLLAHFDNSFASREEQDVLGYAETLEQVCGAFANRPPTEDHIRQLHRDLLRYSPKAQWHRGNYKISVNTVGNQRGALRASSLETASPLAAPRRMRELAEWVHAALDGESRVVSDGEKVHPLLVISIFTAMFLLIHPFQEGNGRLSHILTTLLLLRSGYAYAPYSSLENTMENSGDDYFLVLRQTRGLRTAVPDWQPWLLCFLRALHRQMKRLEQKVEREHRILAALPELSLYIMEQVRDHGRATLKDMTILTGASRNTLKEHFRKLTASGRIVMRGKGRGAWYSLR